MTYIVLDGEMDWIRNERWMKKKRNERVEEGPVLCSEIPISDVPHIYLHRISKFQRRCAGWYDDCWQQHTMEMISTSSGSPCTVLNILPEMDLQRLKKVTYNNSVPSHPGSLWSALYGFDRKQNIVSLYFEGPFLPSAVSHMWTLLILFGRSFSF
jgi:hypothetical protein